MRLLQRILILVLALTPTFQAYAGQSLHADCGSAPAVLSEAAPDVHVHAASDTGHHDHGAVEAALTDSDAADSDCGCGCLCGAGHACQGGTGLPVSAIGYAPQVTRETPTPLDDHLSPAVQADDLRPPISLAH